MSKDMWMAFICLAAWLAVPVARAAAPVEERIPGMAPMANQQQRANYAKARMDEAEQEARAARGKVEALTRAVGAAEQELAARRGELEGARQREALANQRLGEARKQSEKETGVLKALPAGR